MTKITTALLAALVLTQIPSAIESLHFTTCISSAIGDMSKKWPWSVKQRRAVALGFADLDALAEYAEA